MLFVSINFSLEKDSVVFSAFVNYNIMCIEFSSLKCPSPQNIFFAKMNLCTCSKRIAAIFSFFQEILPFYRLRKLRKSKHLLFTTESEGEWVYS